MRLTMLSTATRIRRLKENEDGTFSIVDPVTSIPYPGTVGMEKEKPYRCPACGKAL